MPDLNQRYRSLAALLKAEMERSANGQRLSPEEQARLPGAIREKEKRLEELRASHAARRSELNAYVQMAKPYAGSAQPGPAQQPDMDQLQAVYLHMQMVPGDRDAQLVYRIASGGIAWLDQEEARLSRDIEQDRRRLSEGGRKGSLPEAVQRQRKILQSADFAELLRHCQADYALSMPMLGRGPWSPPAAEANPPFACAWKGLHLLPECLGDFARLAGGYGTKDGRLAVPQRFPSVLEIYPDSLQRTSAILKSVQSWAVNFITRCPPMPERVFWIDGAMMSRASLGILAPLEGSSVAAMALTPADISTQLGRLLSLHKAGKLRGRLLIVRGVKKLAGCQSMLQQLVANSESAGLRVILLHSEQTQPSRGGGDAVFYDKGVCWYYHDGKRSMCSLPEPISAIPGAVAEQLQHLAKPAQISTRYLDYVKTDVLPARQARADFSVDLPYGLLGGQLQSVSFWGVDFAGYLLGASGSGKSTLLHALIAGITLRYHPDDVELWLADMQNSSFSVYARHMPPHVRYLVLDNSVDAITAFIERLYQEHERRNKLRAAAGVEEIWDLPRDQVPPRVFVIVDEFGPLSNALADYNSEKGMKCRTWLTMILQQSRKNGFHLLFSHQNYVSGVKGLTDEAKDQIGLRLLMAADTAEKRECAAIAHRTPEQDSILSSIMPHQLAIRTHGRKLTEDRCLSQPAQVLYLDDSGMEEICRVSDRQRRELRCAPKHPVVVDQSRRITFAERQADMIADLRHIAEPGLALYPGTPRNMDTVQRVIAQRRMNQSFILLCDVRNSADRLQAAFDVFRACIKSSVLQKWSPEIWAGEYDPLTGRLREHYGASRNFIAAEKVPGRIRSIRASLERGEEAQQLILIPDLPQLLVQLSDMEEEARLLRRPPKPAAPSPNPGDADAALRELALAFQQEAPAAPAEPDGDDEPLTDSLVRILRAGPRHGTVMLACADKDSSVFPKPLKAEYFANRFLFRSGAADYDTAKLARTLLDDQTFLYTGVSDQALFTTYAFK